MTCKEVCEVKDKESNIVREGQKAFSNTLKAPYRKFVNYLFLHNFLALSGSHVKIGTSDKFLVSILM